MISEISVNDRVVGATNPFPVGAPVRTWTDITPALLTTTDTTLIAAASGANLNIVKELVFQNNDTVVQTVTLKKGSTAFSVITIPAGAVVTRAYGEGDEQRFATALVATVSATSKIYLSEGRYRVGTS
jgi:hypothetical protein